MEAAYHHIDERNPHYHWGSAVVVLNPAFSLRERPRVSLADCYMNPAKGDVLPESHQGACAVADIFDAENRFRLTAVSLYAQWEVMPDAKTCESSARAHRIVSDLR